MPTRTDSIDEATLERLIAQVRGVTGARVVCDAQGAILEIHVVAAPGRSPKQMVRDIESLLYVRGGVRVDHRKISLTQLAEPEGLPTFGQLVRLVDIEHMVDTHDATIQVMLAVGDRRARGVVRGRAGQPHSAALAGEATIRALNQLSDARGQIRLEELRFQLLGQLEVCLAQLALSGGAGETTLLGISAAHADAETMAARAIVDALNRSPRYALELAMVRGASQ